MKKTCLTVLAATTLACACAAPALAQPYGPGPGGYQHNGYQAGAWTIDRRLDWLQERIRRGREDGSLDWREFRRVDRKLDHIRRDYRREVYRDGGRLGDRDRAEFAARLDRLSDQIRWLRHNDERRPW